MKSQLTTYVQYVLHLNQCTHRLVWLRGVAPCKMSRGHCEWFDRHQKCFCEEYLHFQLWLNTLWFRGVHTDKYLKDWSRTNVSAVRRKPSVCGNTNFFPCFGVRNYTWNMPKYFRYTLYIIYHSFMAVGLRQQHARSKQILKTFSEEKG